MSGGPAQVENLNHWLERARRVIEGETTMVLATAGEDGRAAAAPLFYVPGEGLELYWLSSEASRHSRNLAARPDAAAAVFRSVTRWEEIRGVQMEGEARAVRDPAERERVLARYRERFGLGPEFEGAIGESTLYVFRPRWVRYVDNSEGFGFKVEASHLINETSDDLGGAVI